MLENSFDTSLIALWLANYGSFALLFLLSLGIIALPIPEETMMTAAGILMHEGKLNIPLTILCAYAGTIVGITVSYMLGRTAGSFLIYKYGRYFGFSEEKQKKAHLWFKRLGKWFLTFGYFIPGVRHLTGFSAGTTKMAYLHFALFAYLGAIMWVSLFLSLGYFVGSPAIAWLQSFEITELLMMAGVVIFILIIIFIVVKKIKKS